MKEVGKLDEDLMGIVQVALVGAIQRGPETIASDLQIPVIGVVDTNNSPDNIDYVIPGNDDSMRAVDIYVRCVADAILDGKNSNTVGNMSADSEFVEVSSDAQKTEE